MINLEQIAANAASTYCRCSQCNGVNPDMGTNCCKERSLTCNRYFIGYETALIALEHMNGQLGNPVEKVEQEDCLGMKTYRHWINNKQKQTKDEGWDEEWGFTSHLFDHWKRDDEEFGGIIK